MASLASVTALAAMSAVAIRELVTVCVDPAKCAMPTPGEEATTRFAATTPESVSVQVVDVVAQSSTSPLAGTEIGPTRVLDALMAAAAPIVNVKALEALRKPRVPVVVDATPSTGVGVNAGVDPPRIWPAAPVIAILPVAELMLSGAEAVTAGVPEPVPAVHVGVPAVACGVIVRAPLAEPSSITCPSVVFARPRVSVPFEIFASTLPLTAAALVA